MNVKLTGMRVGAPKTGESPKILLVEILLLFFDGSSASWVNRYSH